MSHAHDENTVDQSLVGSAPLGTFQELLDEYLIDLKNKGRMVSYKRKIFEAHVIVPFPELVAKPACEITATDIATILKRLLNGVPKKPTPVEDMRAATNTLHVSLRAAFAYAHGFQACIDGDPDEPSRFALISNPAGAVRPLDVNSYTQRPFVELWMDATLPE